MENVSFPRWSGPFVGMVLGAGIGAKLSQDEGIPFAAALLCGLTIGAIAGCFVLLIDPGEPDAILDKSPSRLGSRGPKVASDFVGRFLAIAGILLCWMPVLGLALNLVGLGVNRHAEDWARKVSIAGAVVGGLVVAIMVIGLVSSR